MTLNSDRFCIYRIDMLLNNYDSIYIFRIKAEINFLQYMDNGGIDLK